MGGRRCVQDQLRNPNVGSRKMLRGNMSVPGRIVPRKSRNLLENASGGKAPFVFFLNECKKTVADPKFSKHMDKHDRPYKCDLRGCEKLPGFTYSGGLLRHEREVHGKHGGPRNPLNCPHVNCKRHTGKGFSRLENLNEHLRRVHTPGDNETGVPEEREDNLSVVGPSPAPATPTIVTAMTPTERVNEKPERVGEKRKPETDLRVQVKRLQVENHNLRTQVEAQKRQQIAMMEQMQNMQEALQSFTNADQVANRATSASPAAPLLSSSGA
ncbi:hypothetical protein F4779DRAFT_588992 [Xylariaceae sp. FL0662B]|nr:hypothetical protein F4779DRAFT_588992 [Xylariaceae sp. FL0662B]